MLKILKRKNLSKSKIIHIINSLDTGGAENVLFNLIEDNKNKKPIIICLIKKGFYGKILEKKGYRIFNLNLRKDIFIFSKLFKLIFLLIKFKPKTVHTWMYHSNLLGGIFAKILGTKNIFWSIHHDYEYSNLFMMAEIKLLSILSYFIPNKIIYCSKSSRVNHLANGFKKNNTILIENGVCISKFKYQKKLRKIFRDEFKIKKNYLVIGNISRYHPIKDHNTLLNALFKLKQYNVKFKAFLVGKGLVEENFELTNIINKYNLQDNIILYGPCNEVHKIINAFDLTILSSKSECFPITLIESMSCGVPCISTNVGDAKKIIGNSGWTIEKENYLALAYCINNIYKQKYLLKEKSKLAERRVKRFFNIKQTNNKYKKLYPK